MTDWRSGWAPPRDSKPGTPWLTFHPPGWEIVGSASMYPVAGEPQQRIYFVAWRDTPPLVIDGHTYHRRTRARRKRR